MNFYSRNGVVPQRQATRASAPKRCGARAASYRASYRDSRQASAPFCLATWVAMASISGGDRQS